MCLYIVAAQGAATTMSNVAAASYAAHDIIIWQPNYYERIIRNESALNRIREYIMNNPEKEKYDWDRLDAWQTIDFMAYFGMK